MAIRTTYVQNGAYNAPDLRFGQSADLVRDYTTGQVKPGVLKTNDIGAGTVVQASTPNNTVQITPYVAQVSDGEYGAYVGGESTQKSLAIIAPEAANNRRDILCWRPLEGQTVDSRGVTTMATVTLAGSATPISKQVVHGETYFVAGVPSSGSPIIPPVPAGSVLLAVVYVAGGATAITNANIDNTVKTWIPAGSAVYRQDVFEAQMGVAQDAPLGTIFSDRYGELYTMNSSRQLKHYAPLESYKQYTVGSQSAVGPGNLGIYGICSDYPIPANTDLHITGFCRAVNESLVDNVGCIQDIQASINGGSWNRIDHNYVVIRTYAWDVKWSIDATIPRTGADRTISLRVAHSNVVGSGNNRLQGLTANLQYARLT